VAKGKRKVNMGPVEGEALIECLQKAIVKPHMLAFRLRP
jgi:hypothetical protein